MKPENLFYHVLLCIMLMTTVQSCTDDTDQNDLILLTLIALQSQSSACSNSAHCKMFVATDGTSLDGGIATFDSKCASDSNKPSGNSTYKAFVVDGTNRIACTTANCSGGLSEQKDWVMKPNKEYRRKDGSTVIGTTNSNGIFTFPISNAVADGDVFSFIATGFSTNWTNDNSNDCTNFSVTAGNATSGLFSATDSDLLTAGGFSTCSTTGHKIVCVEQ